MVQHPQQHQRDRSTAVAVGSSCRPPPQSTYLTIGQDLFSIQQYLTGQYNASLHNNHTAPVSAFSPAAVMVYTDIQTLRGLDAPTDYGSGIEYADGVLDSLFPTQHVGLQIGLWLNGTQGCNDIITGRLDHQVATLVTYLVRTRASRVFLRIGYEFDNPEFGYDEPETYRRAYIHLVRQCRKRPGCWTKVEFVWHSWGASSDTDQLEAYYPGNQNVDWIGVSIFSQFFPWSQLGNVQDVRRVLDFAKNHDDKPTMIAESTPFGGIDLGQVYQNDTDEVSDKYRQKDAWDRWFQPVLDLIDDYDISMWSYINCDWESQPMWHNIGFGETRVSTNKLVMKRWHDLVITGTQDRKFLLADSLLECKKPPSSSSRNSAVTLMAASSSSASGSTSAMMIPQSSVWVFLVAATGLLVYLWRRPTRELEQQLDDRREARELIRLIRYGSTDARR